MTTGLTCAYAGTERTQQGSGRTDTRSAVAELPDVYLVQAW
jgi:hypothetical protein